MNLEAIDIGVVAGYFAIVALVGFVFSRRGAGESTSAEEFLLAGRKLTLPLFVGTLVATWYGAILGFGEFVYETGVAAWLSFCFPYYVAAGLFAIFIAGRIRSSNSKTIPEQIESKFGARAGFIASIIVLVITIPAAYFLMLGVLIQMFSGWDLWVSIAAGSLLSISFIYAGGFRSDVFVNAAQLVFMYAGFAALTYFSVAKFGAPELMLEKIPDAMLRPTGVVSWQYLLVWQTIALQTFVDPSFHQRCAAAKTPSVARKGVALSILFWIIFDAMTFATALYARAYVDVAAPMETFPALADVAMPPVWKGLFLVALISTVMSTLESYAFLSAATIGGDILPKLRFIAGRKHSLRTLIRAGLIATTIFGVILAAALPSAVDVLYKTASIAAPGLLLPAAASYSEKIRLSGKSIVIIMIGSSGISAIWTALQYVLSETIIFASVEPMIPGVFASIALWAGLREKRADI